MTSATTGRPSRARAEGDGDEGGTHRTAEPEPGRHQAEIGEGRHGRAERQGDRDQEHGRRAEGDEGGAERVAEMACQAGIECRLDAEQNAAEEDEAEPEDCHALGIAGGGAGGNACRVRVRENPGWMAVK